MTNTNSMYQYLLTLKGSFTTLAKRAKKVGFTILESAEFQGEVSAKIEADANVINAWFDSEDAESLQAFLHPVIW